MRRLITTVVLIVVWVVAVVAFFVAEGYLRKPPVEQGNLASIQDFVVREMNDALAQGKLGCAAVAIIQNGKIAAEYGFGVANADTRDTVRTDETLFLLSSLSKAVTAWGAMILVQEGRIGLDDPVLPHLKRWQFPGSGSFRHTVTLRHLLSHTAGLQDGYGHSGFLPGERVPSIEETLTMPTDVNSGEPHGAVIVTEPGTVMSYSSAGYAVVQLLIEEMSGKPFNEYMEEAVLRPLGMVRSTYSLDSVLVRGWGAYLAGNYDLDRKPHPHRGYSNMAGVSLRSTAHDLSHLVMAYYRENPVLSKGSMKEFEIPQPGTSGSWGVGHTLYAENNSGGYILGHGGGAFPASGAETRVNRATGNGIVILATGTQGLISNVADVWMYWETGTTRFDIRNVAHTRGIHAIVAIVVGALALFFRRKRHSTNS